MVLTFTPITSLGQSMPDFSLPGTDGQTYSSESFRGSNILVIIFTCNHCPYAMHVKQRLHKLHEEYSQQGIQMVAINPNDADAYPEDSFTNMKKDEYDFPFPYLYDESQSVARNFGAVCTPDIFVYDKDRKLVYRGQLDDKRPDQPDYKPDDPGYNQDIKQALNSLLQKIKLSDNQVPASGCSIKWKD